ncbi:aldo/keto reductase [Pedobacter sp. AW1-32]|uniref:aldo/keto reductase n=1 Tax=Pedobacter sp. AW1-32 TaxID=3383026 RepID=UPI003FF03E75
MCFLFFEQFDLKKVETFLKAIEPIAASKDASIIQLVFRWTSSQKGITVVLAGARNAAQAKSNAEGIHISNEEMASCKLS